MCRGRQYDSSASFVEQLSYFPSEPFSTCYLARLDITALLRGCVDSIYKSYTTALLVAFFYLSGIIAIKYCQCQHRQSDDEASSAKCYLPTAPEKSSSNYYGREEDT